MKFGPVPLDQATGAVLAHSVRHSEGVFKKGRTLSEADIAVLRADGLATVTAARIEHTDVHEDRAAAALAAAFAGDNVVVSEPFTGRANIYANARGLAEIDAAAITAVNRIHESITVATVTPFEQADHRQMLATVKIIPYAVDGEILTRVCELAESGRKISVRPFAAKKVGIVLTRLDGMKEALLDKSRKVLSDRVEGLDGEVSHGEVVDHDPEAVRKAIENQVSARCSLVLVLGASAIADRNDVIPLGLTKAGGVVSRLGMPVDPGNLLMLGDLAGTPVIGVPSCARSPKLNGFDWVLQRIMADVPVGADNIAGMGVGGLLKEIPTRPQPREGSVRNASAKSMARIAAVVLAAGRSTRMGRSNKLLMDVARKPMVRHVVEAALGSQAGRVVVVTGHEAPAVERALEGLDITFAHNPDFADGMSTSMKSGLDVLGDDIDGALFCLGDMPAIQSVHLDRLIAAFNSEEGREICVPLTDGKRGNPVLWGARFFDDMKQVMGDVGARHLIGVHEEKVCEIDFDDDSVLTDVDTPGMMDEYRNAKAKK